jgi:hypothetical protein
MVPPERGLSQSAARRQTQQRRNHPSRLSSFHPLRVGTTRAPLKIVSRPPKAPEGWRTPRRFARFVRHQSTRQRFGVRWPPTAFPRRNQIRTYFQMSFRNQTKKRDGVCRPVRELLFYFTASPVCSARLWRRLFWRGWPGAGRACVFRHGWR